MPGIFYGASAARGATRVMDTRLGRNPALPSSWRSAMIRRGGDSVTNIMFGAPGANGGSTSAPIPANTIINGLAAGTLPALLTGDEEILPLMIDALRPTNGGGTLWDESRQVCGVRCVVKADAVMLANNDVTSVGPCVIGGSSNNRTLPVTAPSTNVQPGFQARLTSGGILVEMRSSYPAVVTPPDTSIVVAADCTQYHAVDFYVRNGTAAKVSRVECWVDDVFVAGWDYIAGAALPDPSVASQGGTHTFAGGFQYAIFGGASAADNRTLSIAGLQYVAGPDTGATRFQG